MPGSDDSTGYASIDPHWPLVAEVIGKWANSPLPSYLPDLCNTVAERLSELIQVNVALQRISSRPAELEEYAANLAKAVAFTMKASFQLRLEYGSRSQSDKAMPDYVEEQIVAARPLLRAAVLPVYVWLSQQFSFIIESKEYTEASVEQLQDNYSQGILQSQFQCFGNGCIAAQLTFYPTSASA